MQKLAQVNVLPTLLSRRYPRGAQRIAVACYRTAIALALLRSLPRCHSKFSGRQLQRAARRNHTGVP